MDITIIYNVEQLSLTSLWIWNGQWLQNS